MTMFEGSKKFEKFVWCLNWKWICIYLPDLTKNLD